MFDVRVATVTVAWGETNDFSRPGGLGSGKYLEVGTSSIPGEQLPATRPSKLNHPKPSCTEKAGSPAVRQSNPQFSPKQDGLCGF